MEGGPSNVNPPNSHPSNPNHKAVMSVQDPKPAKKPLKHESFNLPTDEVGQIKETFQETEKTDQHEINITAVIVGAVAVVVLAAH